jgi:hypothetical protein
MNMLCNIKTQRAELGGKSEDEGYSDKLYKRFWLHDFSHIKGVQTTSRVNTF